MKEALNGAAIPKHGKRNKNQKSQQRGITRHCLPNQDCKSNESLVNVAGITQLKGFQQ
mgnify:FL=1